MGDTIGKASDFYIDLFSPEQKKLILPVIMVLILSASAFSAIELKQSSETDKIADLTLESYTDLNKVSLKTDFFNESVNESRQELVKEIDQKRDSQANKLESRVRNQRIIAGLQNLGLFPFTAELRSNSPEMSEKSFLTFYAEFVYRQRQFYELGEKLNSSENMSLSEFESEFARIKNVDWNDKQMKDFLKNYSRPEGASGNVNVEFEEARQKIINEEFDQLSFTDYLPSLFGTFLIYFVVNAVVLESGKRAIRELKNPRSEQDKKSKNEDDDSEDEDSFVDSREVKSEEQRGKEQSQE